MNEYEIRVIDSIKAVFANKALEPPPGLGPNTVLDASLGLKSIDFAELVVRLEAEFDKDPFASGDAPPIRTVAELASLYAQ